MKNNKNGASTLEAVLSILVITGLFVLILRIGTSKPGEGTSINRILAQAQGSVTVVDKRNWPIIAPWEITVETADQYIATVTISPILWNNLQINDTVEARIVKPLIGSTQMLILGKTTPPKKN